MLQRGTSQEQPELNQKQGGRPCRCAIMRRSRLRLLRISGSMLCISAATWHMMCHQILNTCPLVFIETRARCNLDYNPTLRLEMVPS